MEQEFVEPILIEEKRLVGTMITKKPSVNAFIVASMTILFITMMTLFYWQGPQRLTDLLPAVHQQIFQHAQIWRAFTAVFIHADIAHLLSNAYMLWIFSFFVFGYFGFGVFPLLSFFIAGIVNVLAILTYAPEVELIGASGLVYILGGFWLTLYPLIQRQYSVVNRLMRVIGISLVIFLPSTFVPSTSYRTHAIGFGFGILMALFYFYKNKKQIRSYEIYKISLV
ncbi:MAG: rhomboid family intramembrane serine protease [Bdellovibrio sp.]|nr:rhomboid family intramembrane serine protease [Bdellovibrio sp.]